jgi:hypothetical protein
MVGKKSLASADWSAIFQERLGLFSYNSEEGKENLRDACDNRLIHAMRLRAVPTKEQKENQAAHQFTKGGWSGSAGTKSKAAQGTPQVPVQAGMSMVPTVHTAPQVNSLGAHLIIIAGLPEKEGEALEPMALIVSSNVYNVIPLSRGMTHWMVCPCLAWTRSGSLAP